MAFIVLTETEQRWRDPPVRTWFAFDRPRG